MLDEAKKPARLNEMFLFSLLCFFLYFFYGGLNYIVIQYMPMETGIVPGQSESISVSIELEFVMDHCGTVQVAVRH